MSFMSKVNINGYIKGENTETFSLYGIYSNNILKYKYNDSLIRLEIYDDMIIMDKKDNDSEVHFTFKDNVETICKYKVYGRNLEFKIFTKNIEINDNKIYINYMVEDNNDIIFNIDIKGDNNDN